MRRSALLFVAATIAACVEKEPPVDKAYVAQCTLSAEPTPKLALNGDLGGKIVYLGADIDKDNLAPGDRFTITHYWKVVQAPGSEWRLFTHVHGSNGKDWMNVDETKLRK